MHSGRLNILHAIHDFLPRHQAGSEIYAFELCRELQRRHDVTVLCAEYDGTRPHGDVTWRLHDGLPVIELVNNWVCRSVVDTYRPPLVGERIGQVLDAVQPDVVHVHNLLNLSFDLPELAKARGAAVVATLHDYTLVCPSGGQRVHRDERHVCHEIDTTRCARCFCQSPFFEQMTVGRVATVTRLPGVVQQTARGVGRRLPGVAGLVARAVGRVAVPRVTASDIARRLDDARRVFEQVDRFVAPSTSLANEFERLGVDRAKLQVSDYGFRRFASPPRATVGSRLRLGFVGSIVWHKGLHVLLEAVQGLTSSDWELRIFGDTDVSPGYASSLRAQATGLPVHFMGAFDHDDAGLVFAGIDVLVVPSLWLENSPLVIHEAFMAGVPVVGSRIGGTADLVRHGETGLLYDPSSSDALCETLQLLVSDRSRVRQLSSAQPVVKTIEADARQWERVYADVVGRRAAVRQAVTR